MGTDLHTPLGQNRPPSRKKPGAFRIGRVVAALCLIIIGSFSVYTSMTSVPLKTDADDKTASASSPDNTVPVTTPPAADAKTLPLADPHSAANVERSVMGDGSVVTTYSPKPRDGKGPVVIGTSQIGQDPRLAATPNDSLIEETPYGRLPIKGPDGRRPMDQYARPWSGARGPRIAIVVGGLGLSQTGTQRAIKQLPEEVTLAFAASGNSLQRWMQSARQSGHEILLQVPLEPFDYPANNPGPDTLLTSKKASDNLDSLHKSMARITNYTGVMNYLGGRFLSNPSALEPVMLDVSARGLLFLDDGSSAQSKAQTIAKATDTPFAAASLQLDNALDRNSILKKLDDLERIARRDGTAIGVASAFDESVDAITQWSEEAALRGIEIVAVSALAADPQNP